MSDGSGELEIVLVSMQAYVERCAAELRDPATTSERTAAIVASLRPIYDALKQLNAEIRAHADE